MTKRCEDGVQNGFAFGNEQPEKTDGVRPIVGVANEQIEDVTDEQRPGEQRYFFHADRALSSRAFWAGASVHTRK